MTTTLTRRGFLQTAAAASILTVGFNGSGALAGPASQSASLTPFVKVYPDGRVVAIIKHFEGGQGVTTGLSALIAEEMNMSLDEISFEMAPAHATYANLAFGTQGTGGSTAIANSFMQYRQAAAAARLMLIEAAAASWGVSADALTLENGVISGAGKSAGLGEFAAAAAAMEPPTEVALKPRSEWRVIGVDQRARLDTPAKINGSAQFSMDVQLDGQMVVAIKRAPRLGALAASFDDSAARQVPGFIMAIQMPNNKGVMAYAETTWAAFEARDALEVQWDFSAAESRSTDALRSELFEMVQADPEFQTTPTDLAAATAALDGAAQIVEQDFYFPLLAHAPMEPMGATVEPTADGGVILHDGAQLPVVGQGVVSQLLELPPEKVQVNTLYAGGFFGRRVTPDSDYLVELALAFSVTDRSRPVKLQWSREDDVRGGYYRPSYVHRARVGLDAGGSVVGWDHRIAGQSIIKGTIFEDFLVHDGVDHSSIEGASDTVYRLPSMHVGLTDHKGPTTSNWWRSVGHSHTAYAMECMMDVCARAAGADPIEFRLRHLAGGEKDQQRLAGVLRLAAEKAGWGGDLPPWHFQGVAAHKSFGSYVAVICETSRADTGAVKIERVVAAVDCGIAVTPDVVKAQIEGGVAFGIGHVMRAEVTLEEGEPVQSNFFDYETLRIYDMSGVEAHIVESDEAPTGVGEPGTPPAGPVLANAIVAAGGPLATRLPMTKSEIAFV